MSRQVNFSQGFKPNFSGHETFALRQGWLEKSYQAIVNKDFNPFLAENAIAEFGVGKNMVNAIKHWALATGFIESSEEKFEPSEYSNLLIGKSLDPYLEKSDTLWKIHYELVKNPRNMTLHWLFCYFNDNVFDKSLVSLRLNDFLKTNGLKLPAEKTLQSDISVSVATYCQSKKTPSKDDEVGSPLSELKLIRTTEDGRFTFNFGPKSSLSDEFLMACIIDYWENESIRLDQVINTLKFEQILHDPRSPGRIFLLNERDLASRLIDIENVSDGGLVWSETTGIQQLQKTQSYNSEQLSKKWMKF